MTSSFRDMLFFIIQLESLNRTLEENICESFNKKENFSAGSCDMSISFLRIWHKGVIFIN